MKKYIVLLLVLVMLCCIQPVMASAAENACDHSIGGPCDSCGAIDSGKCGEDAYWAVYADKSLVISGTGTIDEITTYPWRQNYSTMHTLRVEEGITTLPWYAFGGMTQLTSVELPDTLTSIPAYCFSGCTSLEAIDIPDGVRYIGEYAFNSCNSLTSLVIPDSVQTEKPMDDEQYDDYYMGASNITNMFEWCNNLRELTIGAGIEFIPDDDWGGMDNGLSSLETIHVSANNPNYVSVDGVVYTKDMKTLVQVPGARGGSFTIPDGVEIVYQSAIHYNGNITEINIPASVTDFRIKVYGCSALENINVDSQNKMYSSVDGILYNKAKTNLLNCGPSRQGSVQLPSGIWEISNMAFYDCTLLTEVILPDSLEKIGSSAFSGCSSLKKMVVPPSVTHWGQFAFNECTSLEWIAFGIKDKTVYQDFGSCYALTNVYYYLTEEDWNTLNISSFDWSFANAEKVFNAVHPGTYAISYELGGGVNDSANPDTYYNYGDDLILKAPSREGYIFDGWFLDGEFTAAVMGSVIDKGYTEGDMTFHAKWITGSDDHVHSYVDGVCYCGAAYGQVNETVRWELDPEGTLTISGTGLVDNNPWIEHRTSIQKLVIGEGITETSGYLFCDMEALTEVVIPDSMTVLAGGSFWGCYNLSAVDLGEGVQRIEDGAFWGCSALEEITIPASVVYMGYGVFAVDFYGEVLAQCNLKSVRFEGSAPEIRIVEQDWGNEQSIFTNTESPITIYYPADDLTWTDNAKATFGGNLSWSPAAGEEPIPGDMSGDGVLDDNDVAQLLWHTLFVDEYPISGDADFTGDGIINDEDVAYLLWHTLFPENYPL